MSQSIQLTLTKDQTDIILDALEADLEDYIESAKEARENGDFRDAATFDGEADRIKSLLHTLQELLPGEAG